LIQDQLEFFYNYHETGVGMHRPEKVSFHMTSRLKVDGGLALSSAQVPEGTICLETTARPQ
jgi:hypothetical protein